MQSEMDAVQENRTWELADLPRGHRAITLKWVFKLKRWFDSDVRRLHHRVRPLRGSWGSRQLFFTERVYPSPRASTDSDTNTPSGHDFDYDELFVDTTPAGDPTRSSTNSHSSEHVYSDASSC